VGEWGGHDRLAANAIVALLVVLFGLYSAYFADYYRRSSFLRVQALLQQQRGP
jgi:hypothetical protein